MNRRNFLTTTATITGAALFSACDVDDKYKGIKESKYTQKESLAQKGVNINRNTKLKLKLATSWPASFPIIGTAVERFVARVKEASGESIDIKLYPKDSLVPALAVFDATSAGTIDMFHSGPYYWKGKNSAFSLFSGTPFGFTSEEINAWMLYDEGYTLWRAMYAKHNLYPFMGGNTNVQMGGWFRKPIRSLDDLKGLKMRIPGLGGDVMAKLGVNPVLLAAGDIYSALERATIDATEWVGPALDIKMGFYKVAPYYYSGWHEPGSILELTFNKKKWESISREHQAILSLAATELNNHMSYDFAAQNAHAILKLKSLGINIKRFPNEVIDKAKMAFKEVVDEHSQKNSDFKTIYNSTHAFLERAKLSSDIGLGQYLNVR